MSAKRNQRTLYITRQTAARLRALSVARGCGGDRPIGALLRAIAEGALRPGRGPGWPDGGIIPEAGPGSFCLLVTGGTMAGLTACAAELGARRVEGGGPSVTALLEALAAGYAVMASASPSAPAPPGNDRWRGDW